MSNFNPGNYYRNIDRYGSEIVNEGSPDFVPTPINYTPAASGNTQNINEFVIDPNGDMYFIDADGESFKINTNSPLDVLTTVQPTPSATGNTTNLNSVFKDSNDITWIVDANGDAIQASSPETVTTLTNTLATGKVIGTYTNEAGVAVDIKETITTLVNNNNDTFTYTNENGVTTIIDLTPYKDDRYKTTSTTCNNISVPGTKTFIVEPGLSYTPLQEVILYADVDNYIIGEVVTYNAVTGELVVDVKFRRGSGTFCSWTANLNAIKLSPVSVYFQADDPVTSGTTGIEGDEVFVTSDGTCTGTVTEWWIYDDLCGWKQIQLSKPELVQFGTTAPTSTTGYTAGDEYFVTSNGTSTGAITAQYIFNGTTWTLRSSALITTSIQPVVYNGSSYVPAQANADTNLADLIKLSDGSYIHDGKVIMTSHGYEVGKWYYLSQTSAGAVISTQPTSQWAQQLFFVEDANTIHVDIEEGWNADLYPTPSIPHGVFAYQQTGQSIPHNTVTNLLNLSTVNNTAGSGWNAATGVFTAQRAGWYSVGLKVFFQAGNWAGGTQTQAIITKNGSYVASNYVFAPVNITNYYMNSNETNERIYLNAGDTVRGQVYQNSGAPKLISGGIYSTFSVVEIR